MQTHGLQTPPTPWHSSLPGTHGSSTSSHLRAQANPSTSLAASSHLTLGHGLPPKPATPSDTQTNGFASGPLAPMSSRVRQPPPSLLKARWAAASTNYSTSHVGGTSVDSTLIHSIRLRSHGRRGGRNRMPLAMDHHSLPHSRSRSRSRSWSPSRSQSRSPSPTLRRPGQSIRNMQARPWEAVLEALTRNHHEHVKIDGNGGHLGGAVTEDDVRAFVKEPGRPGAP